MSHILLLESNHERVPNLIFLLKLVDIHCTLAKTTWEALDWLTANQQKLIHFDLFLLSSLEGIELEKQSLPEMLDSIDIPVVVIQRENLPLPDLLSDATITCNPDNILSCLDECLVPENKATEM